MTGVRSADPYAVAGSRVLGLSPEASAKRAREGG